MEPIILEKEVFVPPVPTGVGDDGNGVNAFIYRGKKMDEIQERYGRTNCCLKVIKNREGFEDTPEKHYWGPGAAKGSPLSEATHVQNIYAFHDLAPRVYALMVVKIRGKRHWAQLTDDLGHWEVEDGKQTELIKGPMKDVAKKYGIKIFNDGRDYNVVAGKYVDFQGFRLAKNYNKQLKKRMTGVANAGKWGPWQNYHSIKKLGIGGGRKNYQRVKEMKLKKVDFKGKTVLDVGCSEGFFCFYADKRGAKRVTGIDLKEVIEPTKELASYLGHYNVDFVGMNLKKVIPDMGKFDIVLFLSMVQHIGFPDWVIEVTRELIIFEGNGKDRDNEATTKITKGFKSYEYIGETTDLFNRPVIWGKRQKK